MFAHIVQLSNTSWTPKLLNHDKALTIVSKVSFMKSYTWELKSDYEQI